MAKLPSRISSSAEIARFLSKSRAITEVVERRPRLLFAVDATASRQPTWNRARQLQQEMFRSTAGLGSLAVQLCYYRGFHEFSASPWLTDSEELARRMGEVACEGGHTQVKRLLQHALDEHRRTPVRAVVFIGDALEESPDTLCDLAGQCGMRGLPLFLFQEGRDSLVQRTFRDMAKLSKGAWARFDANSANTLAELLGAVARYAAGGVTALENSASSNAKLLLEQLRH
ncbi:MAG: VWA domain-containing protein [Halioglobus sp.]|nr:VWA domain-containing protein [Halioglobus sp.]